jgi:hypothetical protein
MAGVAWAVKALGINRMSYIRVVASKQLQALKALDNKQTLA